MEILSPDAQLPALYIRRIDRVSETRRYIARPGLRAMPSGTGAAMVIVGLQSFGLISLLCLIWWPFPRSVSDYAMAIGCSSVLALMIVGMIVVLLRRNPGFLLAILRAPFISIEVTDRRVLWTLPWMRGPLMEIGHERVIGGILGDLDAYGNGPAALVLVPGDPCADIDGNIHFDRLPNAAAFVAALDV